MPAIDCMEQPELQRAIPVSAADREFLAAFEDCTLPESEWTHEAHVRVAWTCLQLDEPNAALERVRDGILRYNTDALKRRHKYHDTVTIAFTRIVAARLREDEPWEEFSNNISDILDSDEPILLRYYSPERLFSDAARGRFVEPDLAPLPPLAAGG